MAYEGVMAAQALRLVVAYGLRDGALAPVEPDGRPPYVPYCEDLGGDRWIVRGAKGEAWACDCLKTGYDEDAYEGSDDAEPIINPSLIEVENAKLQEQGARLFDKTLELADENAKLRKLISSYWRRTHTPIAPNIEMDYLSEMRELGVEVD